MRNAPFSPSQTSLLGNRGAEFGDLPSPKPNSARFTINSISDKYSLPPDPQTWGAPVTSRFAEPDDALHNPTVRNGKIVDDGNLSEFSSRGVANLGCLFLLGTGLLTLFVGYPIISFAKDYTIKHNIANNLGVNGSGQVPDMGAWNLIDSDTPKDARKRKSYVNGDDSTDWVLVFSDEFETDGRTFYPGEDPYWEAVDLHYWGTNNMEWYDPAGVTTGNGSMLITLSVKPTHGLDYQGGMVQTWNKFCFTGGLVEAAVRLPGTHNIAGLWPAVWGMGNLGRAGYGASLDGTWPYTYDSCDVGTLKNQTSLDGLPEAARTSGGDDVDGSLSYLPGQRLSRCTCPGESHPGPMHSDGTYVGRAAPEIDIFEAQVTGDGIGEVSQSGQWAPFNEGYIWDNSSANFDLVDPSISELNTYMGGSTQQATSVVSKTNQDCYQHGGTDCFAVYGFEYKPGFDKDDAYIGWINDGKYTWSIQAAGVGADSGVEIGARPVPQEPFYLIANLGMSTNFGTVDLDHIAFPAIMAIDYIRVYQHPDRINLGCDPVDFPTKDYIDTYMEAYTNPNLTTWEDDFKQKIPKNSLIDSC
ncbi:glycoside hydrolase family 16 protein [Cylindrobasidium torrendii FP15055 ss-10]|uniref:Glycoside hydrolase family 16 protein n=1 Tax=Cylindrobasidium torrendii FP15055 ss-10 TaxID=1314674 RepID=A0A0D7BB22_9AGAR|nr:glycoside hydrolase family 16 protein [Cylindrobasidium torrendii FP15055 ss-10]